MLFAGRPLGADRKEKLLSALFFLRMAADFPGDVACWCIYSMNYVVVQPENRCSVPTCRHLRHNLIVSRLMCIWYFSR